MASIGNTVLSVPFITDTFSGTGSQTAFTPLTRAPAGTASIAVYVSGSYKTPGADYTLSGTTLTFAAAPAAGTNNIVVLHLGNGSITQVPSTGSVALTSLASDTYGYINAAFATANSDTSTSNSAASYANSGFAVANSGSSYANSGFATANSSATYANSAFLKANTPTHVANSAASYANSAYTQANTSVSYISTSNSSILVTNTSITANTTVAPNTGGLSIGPLVIGSGVVLTISANARHVIL